MTAHSFHPRNGECRRANCTVIRGWSADGGKTWQGGDAMPECDRTPDKATADSFPPTEEPHAGVGAG